MIRPLAIAVFVFSLAAQAQGGQRSTTVVGGPYNAVIMAGSSTQQVLGPGISKAMFDADFMLLTTSDREVVLSKSGVSASVLPIPLDFAVRFAEAIQNGITACKIMDEKREITPRVIDKWSWSAIPITHFGKRDAKPMDLSITAERSGEEEPCMLVFHGEGAFPKTFVSYIGPVQAQKLFEDLVRIEDAAKTLDALKANTDGMLDGLQ
jgi:hypothetical protein